MAGTSTTTAASKASKKPKREPSKTDLELRAMKRINIALDKFQPAEKKRILTWLASQVPEASTAPTS
jgi:hypothetical protein